MEKWTTESFLGELLEAIKDPALKKAAEVPDFDEGGCLKISVKRPYNSDPYANIVFKGLEEGEEAAKTIPVRKGGDWYVRLGGKPASCSAVAEMKGFNSLFGQGNDLTRLSGTGPQAAEIPWMNGAANYLGCVLVDVYLNKNPFIEIRVAASGAKAKDDLAVAYAGAKAIPDFFTGRNGGFEVHTPSDEEVAIARTSYNIVKKVSHDGSKQPPRVAIVGRWMYDQFMQSCLLAQGVDMTWVPTDVSPADDDSPFDNISTWLSGLEGSSNAPDAVVFIGMPSIITDIEGGTIPLIDVPAADALSV